MAQIKKDGTPRYCPTEYDEYPTMNLRCAFCRHMDVHTRSCDYMLHTGRRRQAPVGTGCDKFRNAEIFANRKELINRILAINQAKKKEP